MDNNKTFDNLIVSLDERVRELNCLYEIEEVLADTELGVSSSLEEIVNIIPSGWQYTEACRVRIVHKNNTYESNDFRESIWFLTKEIKAHDGSTGIITVFYTEDKPDINNGPFLEDEKNLLDTIATRIGHYVMYSKLKLVFNKWESTKQEMSEKNEGEWKVIIELLKRTDPDLFSRISRKMLNHLIWQGISESEELLQEFTSLQHYEQSEVSGEVNMPIPKKSFRNTEKVNSEIFKLAKKYLTKTEILSNLQKWMQQDKTAFLVRAVANNDKIGRAHV